MLADPIKWMSQVRPLMAKTRLYAKLQQEIQWRALDVIMRLLKKKMDTLTLLF